MFDLLKKKLSSFVTAITGKVESKAEEQKPEEKTTQPQPPEREDEISEKFVEKENEKFSETEPKEIPFASEQTRRAPIDAVAVIQKETPVTQVEVAQGAGKEIQVQKIEPLPKLHVASEQKSGLKAEELRERELAPKFGLLKKVASFFSSEIEISDAEVKPVLDELEFALLESDVSASTSDFLVKDLRGRLSGMRVKKAGAGEQIKSLVRESLLKAFQVESFDFFNFISAVKAKGEVAVVLFVGPNGSGKTTTVAKLAKQMQQRGVSTVISASDTFRKAAIEQAVLHGERLGIRVVKQGYGADPTAVAFDAISHARANKVDCVLIDTAGRQETNYNLVKEMEKMDRVLKPHLKIFVGEAIAGNSLIEQVRKFNDSVKLDGVILTKLDCDAKGGGALSIVFETKLPILFAGVGQEYDDLRTFDAEWVVDNIFIAG